MQQKDNNKHVSYRDISIGNVSYLNPRKKVLYLHKKTERIVTAVFLITRDDQGDNLVKDKIRQMSLNLVGEILKLLNADYYLYGSNLEAVDTAFVELSSYLTIAQLNGYISKMNHSVVSAEIELARKYIEEELKNLSSDRCPIGEEFFKVQESVSEDRVSADKGHNYVKDIKDISKVSDPVASNLSRGLVGSRKINLSDKGFRNFPESRIPFRKNSRRAVILETLKLKDGLSIKDISTLIKDCSEKTIQRELATLVQENVLKRVGERRWSTYHLV